MPKGVLVIVISVIIIGGLIFLVSSGKPKRSPETSLNIKQTSNMKLESAAFEHEGVIPSKYTCDGENISPPLRIADVRGEVKSLALIMDDPDVPKNLRPDGMWDHWLVWNIPPETTEIPEGQKPAGVVGKNTGGSFGYRGPCPPDREHRYFFKLYALDTMLDLSPEMATKTDLEEAMEGHTLERTELMGRYNRQ